MHLHQHGQELGMSDWRGRDERRLNEDKQLWRLNSSFVSLHGDGFMTLLETLIQFNICNVCSYSPVSLGDPHNDPNAQGDAFKTLFVARVVSVLLVVSHLEMSMQIVHAIDVIFIFPFQNYDTTESKLRREFEVYGPIKRVSWDYSVLPQDS